MGKGLGGAYCEGGGASTQEVRVFALIVWPAKLYGAPANAW